ncbi:TIGR01458 family HAD-type hydrolase [Leptospira borgpetersenii]|uniref:TIGR01458 family HAD-type hydrolase n=1 Tax=Leptospira borgpetersenii TaxID=174 RepID=UPI000773D9F4|nr:TIGR01458 family HAD-type hydrolase [Leptospira borgpetersenii]MBE8401637.1 TIGR01458 family HAD-type hydrolase [Leptospira borgpetersenii serovar Tarassovi]MBE8404615.1 TIGR01458 family HAD-type hydrolase [Leptospira borgpetersenii serovar Tarassovi]MBE8407780.1 TIGR01458 family HAD-type hydrolase [Leptospira borgpetersenii serovar Tarassovi]MBE8414114.1 TIGR01458 family HAD-type hydrolase [Leptospira borgpetersenii serovar Tarassovi]MBE8417397.1 TIGR01458 family HAD-type hydrolase [Leptos
MNENAILQKRIQTPIRGVLLDLDGVLYTGDSVLPGAREAVSYLKENHIPHLFLTNTTTKSRKGISEFLNDLKIPVEEKRVLNSPRAAGEYIRETGNPKTFFVIREEVKKDLEGIDFERKIPEAVLIGDIGEEWNYGILNDIFQKVKGGARLIALHKGKYWQTKEGLMLDIGAFVSGIEYATGVKAEIIGKPSPAFFKAALKMISTQASETIMIGDDLDSDVGGAQVCGIRGVLVKTGKYRNEILQNSNVRPDAIWENISSLIPFFQKF